MTSRIYTVAITVLFSGVLWIASQGLMACGTTCTNPCDTNYPSCYSMTDCSLWQQTGYNVYTDGVGENLGIINCLHATAPGTPIYVCYKGGNCGICLYQQVPIPAYGCLNC